MKKLIFKSIITNFLSPIEEDWLLNINILNEIEKYYPEYLSFYKKNDCGVEFRKLSITRDIYKYLLFDKIEYRIQTQLDRIVFELLVNSNLQIIKRLLKGASRHRRLIANLMSFAINKQISEILKLVNNKNKILKEKKKDGKEDENKPKGKKDGNDKAKGNNTKEKDENELKDNIVVLVKKELREIENKIKEIKTLTEQSAGKRSNIFKTKALVKKNLIKLDKNTLEKIKNQGKSIYSFYHSQENIQHLTNFPFSTDYAILENTLFFSKILNKEFTKLDKRSVIALDLYVDISESMKEDNKIEYARTIIWQLKRIGIKFINVYIFDIVIRRIKLEEIFEDRYMGFGTNINNVLENIKKRNKYCLIISDLINELESDAIKILQKYKSKISVILLGDTNERYLHNWKKTTGFALWFKIKK